MATLKRTALVSLLDFCVADAISKLTVNGLVCKNHDDMPSCSAASTRPETPTRPPPTRAITPFFAAELPELNTLGLSIVRFDFAHGGLNVPHIHPRATELLTVLQGELYVGFATTLYAGDLFVSPKGLVHFQLNVGKGPAVALTALSSPNPGVQQVAPALFAASPPIRDEVLQKAFRLNQRTVQHIKASFEA